MECQPESVTRYVDGAEGLVIGSEYEGGGGLSDILSEEVGYDNLQVGTACNNRGQLDHDAVVGEVVGGHCRHQRGRDVDCALVHTQHVQITRQHHHQVSVGRNRVLVAQLDGQTAERVGSTCCAGHTHQRYGARLQGYGTGVVGVGNQIQAAAVVGGQTEVGHR